MMLITCSCAANYNLFILFHSFILCTCSEPDAALPATHSELAINGEGLMNGIVVTENYSFGVRGHSFTGTAPKVIRKLIFIIL